MLYKSQIANWVENHKIATISKINRLAANSILIEIIERDECAPFILQSVLFIEVADILRARENYGFIKIHNPYMA